MSALRHKMMEDLQLRGLSARTQESYLQAVSQLARYYRKPPDQIDEEELRQYFLYLKNVRHLSRSTQTLALCGIKFFFEHTLERPWHLLEFARPAKENKLPVVLSVEEVKRVLEHVHRPSYRVCLRTAPVGGCASASQRHRWTTPDAPPAFGQRQQRSLRTFAGRVPEDVTKILADPPQSRVAISGAARSLALARRGQTAHEP